jgi:hypothetical protein
VGHCRCSLLLASGGTCRRLTCSLECPVRFRRYLLVILLISSSTNGILEASWRVLLLTYHGALNTVLSILDCTLYMMFVLDGLAQPQSCIPRDHMGLIIGLYKSNLFSVVSRDFLPISQFICRILRLIWVFLAVM